MLSEGEAVSISLSEAVEPVLAGCGSEREHAPIAMEKQHTKHETNARTRVGIPRFPSASPQTYVDAID